MGAQPESVETVRGHTASMCRPQVHGHSTWLRRTALHQLNVHVYGDLVSKLFTVSQQIHSLTLLCNIFPSHRAVGTGMFQNTSFNGNEKKKPRHLLSHSLSLLDITMKWASLCFPYYASMPSILVNQVLPTALRELSFLEDLEPNFLRSGRKNWLSWVWI